MRTYIRKRLQVQEIEDVQSLCRLCLGKTDEMISIFDSKLDDMIFGLPMRIRMCLGLEVSSDDMFPKCICQLCNRELDKFYSFKRSCTATYRKLKASIFAIKQTDRKIRNDLCNQEKDNNTSCKSNETKDHITINPSQSLDQNELSLEIPRNELQIVENIQQEKEASDKNEMENCVYESELKREKDCHKNPLSELKVECNVNENQLGDGNEIIDVVKTQQDGKKCLSNQKETTQCLPEYIVTSLIDKGVLARRDDALDVLDPNIKTFTLETSCGSEIVLELVEEDPFMSGDECTKSSRPKIFEPNLKNDGRCCGACGARFGSRGALVRHARVHSGERPFACRACGRRFAQREVLRRHQLLHADKLPYACAQCPKAYTQRGALEAHARAHAPPAARPLVLHRCSRCPKLFLYPSGLSRHMSVHQGREYPCDECPRTFTDKSSLQRHRRAHQRRPR